MFSPGVIVPVCVPEMLGYGLAGEPVSKILGVVTVTFIILTSLALPAVAFIFPVYLPRIVFSGIFNETFIDIEEPAGISAI